MQILTVIIRCGEPAGCRNVGYEYTEIIFLSLLLLQQHKQPQEDTSLGGGRAHLEAHPA